ncbi:hypothetical protein MsAg5_00480 [Methanosarcinaceae archaeon Ag5]|uniref:GLUG domain-containing protein n=1 Tax=Methanolapillus africanus TaxID=3028297 RepID=A0AAE4MGK4_9EURY|nr:hypothetical protein [Methanosarcinaceae archaeon Ag5]
MSLQKSTFKRRNIILLIILILLLLLLSTSCLSYGSNTAQYCSCCNVTSGSNIASGYTAVPEKGGNPADPINVTPGGNGTKPEEKPLAIGLELYDYNENTDNLRVVMTLPDGTPAPDATDLAISYQQLSGADAGTISTAIGLADYSAYVPSSYSAYLVTFKLDGDRLPGNEIPYAYKIGYKGGNATVNYPFESGTGTTSSPFVIQNIVQFDALRYAEGTGMNFKLNSSLDYPDNWNNRSNAEFIQFERAGANTTWTPVYFGDGWRAVGNNTIKFNGNLNGNGKTLSKFTYNNASQDDVGLFGVTGIDSSFENMSLENFSMTGFIRVGGFISNNFGRVNDVTLSEITVNGHNSVGNAFGNNSGNVNNVHVVNSTASGFSYVGGFVGSHEKDLISNCSVSWENPADIKVSGTSHYFGGFAGMAHSDIADCYAENFDVRVDPSYDSQGIGGFAGSATGRAGISGCNLTNVSARNVNVTNLAATSSSYPSMYTGGLVGVVSNATVQKSYATGDVSGRWYVGGLVGGTADEGSIIKQSYAAGNVTGNFDVGGLIGFCGETIEDCYATGDVESVSYLSGAGNAGGFAGRVGWGTSGSNPALYKCYASGNVKSDGYAGGISGSTAYPIHHCIALNENVESTTFALSAKVSPYFGMNVLENDYALNSMTLVGDDTLFNMFCPDANGIGIDRDDADETFFSGTGSGQLGWDFTDIWEWNSTLNRPVLKGMPAA